MFKITRFSIIYTFRKASTWMFLGIAAVLVGLVNVAIAKSNAPDSIDKDFLPYLLNGFISFSAFLVFAVFLTGYMSLKVANIFKDGEKDGSTLLLISKNFTRKQIIMGRFVAVFIHLIIISFAIIITTIFFTFTNKGEITGNAIKTLFSYFLGEVVVGIFLTLISLLFAVILGKAGTIIIAITLGAALPISSVILQAVGDAEKTSYIYKDHSVTAYYNGNDDKIHSINVINKEGFDVDINKTKTPNEIANEIYDTFNKSIDVKYNKFAYVDVWAQISSSFGLITRTNPAQTAKLKDNSTIDINEINTNSIKNVDYITTDEYIFAPQKNINLSQYDKNVLDLLKTKLTSVTFTTKKLQETWGFIKILTQRIIDNDADNVISTVTTQSTTNSPFKSTTYIVNYANGTHETITSYPVGPFDGITKPSYKINEKMTFLNNDLVQYYDFQGFKDISNLPNIKSILTPSDKGSDMINTLFNDFRIKDNVLLQKAIVKKDFINNNVAAGIWILISTGLIGLVFLIHIKKDFK